MFKNSKISDLSLWNNFKAGNKQAFKEIYYNHYMLLYNYGIKTCNDEELTEDCIQDLFLKFWKNRENLGEVESIKNYVYKAFNRALFDAIQKSKKNLTLLDFNTSTETESIEEILVKNQTEMEWKQKLLQSLNLLTKRQRQVIELHYYEGLSYKQISEVLPIKYQAIRNCAYEAIKTLRENAQSPTL